MTAISSGAVLQVERELKARGILVTGNQVLAVIEEWERLKAAREARERAA